MLVFKGCPRCRGDMELTRDMYGKYGLCMQCGYTVDVVGEVTAKASFALEKRGAGLAEKKAA